MRVINRIVTACRYLKNADPIWQWRLHHAPCPYCRGRRFLSLRTDAYMTRCLSCRANVISLSLIPVIQSHAKNHPVATAWEMSTYGVTLAYLKRHIPHVHASEYFPGKPSGSMVNGVHNQDVQHLSFADESMDLITSNQVFEHVTDDQQGYRECFRVLRRNGALVFTVPLYDINATVQLATVDDGITRYLSTPEFHDSRFGGPRSALCYWRHSVHDVVQRVAAAGFTTELVPVNFLQDRQQISYVIYGRKP